MASFSACAVEYTVWLCEWQTSDTVKVTGYSCVRHAKRIGKCILKLANQKSLVWTAWATWFWRWRGAVTRCSAHGLVETDCSQTVSGSKSLWPCWGRLFMSQSDLPFISDRRLATRHLSSPLTNKTTYGAAFSTFRFVDTKRIVELRTGSATNRFVRFVTKRI